MPNSVRRISAEEAKRMESMGLASRRPAELEKVLSVMSELIEAENRRAAFESQMVAALAEISARQEQAAARFETLITTLTASMNRPRPSVAFEYDSTGRIVSMNPEEASYGQ